MADHRLDPAPTDAELHAVAAGIEAVFERIHRERMHDVPIINPALGIKAVGTRAVEEGWLSVLVTPWFINLMLLPRTAGQRENLCAALLGSKVVHAFPAGRFEFIVGEESDLGRYRMCSLFSPVLEFESHDAALTAAEAAIAALFDARLAPEEADAGTLDATDAAAARAPASGVSEAGKLSRRGLLFGHSPESEVVRS